MSRPLLCTESETDPIEVPIDTSLALTHQGREGITHCREIEQLPLDQGDFVSRQLTRVGTTICAVQSQEAGDFFQSEP